MRINPLIERLLEAVGFDHVGRETSADQTQFFAQLPDGRIVPAYVTEGGEIILPEKSAVFQGFLEDGLFLQDSLYLLPDIGGQGEIVPDAELAGYLRDDLYLHDALYLGG